MTPFMKTGLISPLGKAAGCYGFDHAEAEYRTDESLGHFLERRLGKEVLERIVEPLLAGIYAGDTFKLSLKVDFPPVSGYGAEASKFNSRDDGESQKSDRRKPRICLRLFAIRSL